MPAKRRPTRRTDSVRGASRPGGVSVGNPGRRSASSPASRSSAESSTPRPPGERPSQRRSSRPNAARSAHTAKGRRRLLLLPEVMTIRTLVLAVIVGLAFVLLLPTVRAYVNQTGELRSLRQQLAQAQAQQEALELELIRWDDQTYVMQQARDRLNYIVPGETAWRVIDPEVAADPSPSASSMVAMPSEPGPRAHRVSWYQSIWESVQMVGAGSPSGGQPSSEQTP